MFAADKRLRRWQSPLTGYEIHHGRLARCAETGWFDIDSEVQGVRSGAVFGTHWHGLLDNDDFRRAWLTQVAAAAGRSGFVIADGVNVAARRDAQLDLMADLLTSHVDVKAVLGLLAGRRRSCPIWSANCGFTAEPSTEPGMPAGPSFAEMPISRGRLAVAFWDHDDCRCLALGGAHVRGGADLAVQQGAGGRRPAAARVRLEEGSR
ncbi:cobB/CobQ-like glutamine amidotransferase domain protein [Mycobacterium kansasii 824]|nr:cobB/CobQ-like glutamine amidotransferase domain protein [Mycobacterium kansasii 824]